METSEPHTAGEVNIISWEKVGEQLGESWGTAFVDIWDNFYTCAKIPKPEVKQPDAKLHAQKFPNQRYCLRKHIHAKILKPVSYFMEAIQKFRNQS